MTIIERLNALERRLERLGIKPVGYRLASPFAVPRQIKDKTETMIKKD